MNTEEAKGLWGKLRKARTSRLQRQNRQKKRVPVDQDTLLLIGTVVVEVHNANREKRLIHADTTVRRFLRKCIAISIAELYAHWYWRCEQAARERPLLTPEDEQLLIALRGLIAVYARVVGAVDERHKSGWPMAVFDVVFKHTYWLHSRNGSREAQILKRHLRR